MFGSCSLLVCLGDLLLGCWVRWLLLSPSLGILNPSVSNWYKAHGESCSLTGHHIESPSCAVLVMNLTPELSKLSIEFQNVYLNQTLTYFPVGALYFSKDRKMISSALVSTFNTRIHWGECVACEKSWSSLDIAWEQKTWDQRLRGRRKNSHSCLSDALDMGNMEQIKIWVQMKTVLWSYVKFEAIYLNFNFPLQEEIHKSHGTGLLWGRRTDARQSSRSAALPVSLRFI